MIYGYSRVSTDVQDDAECHRGVWFHDRSKFAVRAVAHGKRTHDCRRAIGCEWAHCLYAIKHNTERHRGAGE